ncbi:MAG: hypothetical protein U5M23_02930 [Marinagarivorans sp.]|nr:hypothetical protein [Marinagarivorans sp.]
MHDRGGNQRQVDGIKVVGIAKPPLEGGVKLIKFFQYSALSVDGRVV